MISREILEITHCDPCPLFIDISTPLMTTSLSEISKAINETCNTYCSGDPMSVLSNRPFFFLPFEFLKDSSHPTREERSGAVVVVSRSRRGIAG